MTIHLALTIDVGHDGQEIGQRSPVTWNDLAWLEPIKQLLTDLELTATWFVRADDQLTDLYGSAAHLLKSHADFWSQVVASGDEVGWHPLLSRRLADGEYVAEPDPAARAEKLLVTHADLEADGFSFASVRMGWLGHANETMATFEGLGFAVDSTALPGRVRNEGPRPFDWGPTPNRPYHPSRHDYRVPDQEDARAILEVPLTAVLVPAPYDSAPVRRYINPTFHHEAFRAAIERYLSEAEDDETAEHALTLIVHPGEVAPRPGRHPLYAFSIDELRRNLSWLQDRLRQVAEEHRTSTISEVARQSW